MMNKNNTKLILLTALISISNISLAEKAPFESSYEPLPSTNTIFRNANIYDGEGNEFSETDLLIKDGKIIAMGTDLPGSPEFIEVDASGKWITPGIIDIHSHMGVYSAPSVSSSSDGNESTSPINLDSRPSVCTRTKRWRNHLPCFAWLSKLNWRKRCNC